jgi:hypothetical protein
MDEPGEVAAAGENRHLERVEGESVRRLADDPGPRRFGQ